MTTEQLERAKQIDQQLKSLRGSKFSHYENIQGRAVQIKFISANRDDRESFEPSDSLITDAGLKVWLQEEMDNLAERLKSKLEKRIKVLEKELENL